jgi:hypothetical protein
MLSIHISHRKNLAEHWDLPNTGIFYSKDVAAVEREREHSLFYNVADWSASLLLIQSLADNQWHLTNVT